MNFHVSKFYVCKFICIVWEEGRAAWQAKGLLARLMLVINSYELLMLISKITGNGDCLKPNTNTQTAVSAEHESS